jgi:hypothetical protein
MYGMIYIKDIRLSDTYIRLYVSGVARYVVYMYFVMKCFEKEEYYECKISSL